jgi:monofunctional biosynthetic peptidoglycan transglycosylase
VAWKTKRVSKSRPLRRILRWVAVAAAGTYGSFLLGLVALKWLNPPTTAVQAERRIESWVRRTPYRKRYDFVPLSRISPSFQHAVIAAEDTRFYQHHGFDWTEIQDAIDDGMDGVRLRGASTITQQLVKNLFLTTSHSFVRKGVEFTLVPPAELLLGKRRILELYMNVVEWGPGIYGAEAAARQYYREPAARVSREEGARLAAILPAPRRRKPARMDNYSRRIIERMETMGW